MRAHDPVSIQPAPSGNPPGAGTTRQHRILNPLDWPDDWIFTDERFELTYNDEALLALLVEMLHPEVRTNLAEVEQLRAFLNKALVHDGYEIVQVDAISGAPIFDYRLTGSGVRGSMKNLIFAALGPKPEICSTTPSTTTCTSSAPPGTAWCTTGRWAHTG